MAAWGKVDSVDTLRLLAYFIAHIISDSRLRVEWRGVPVGPDIDQALASLADERGAQVDEKLKARVLSMISTLKRVGARDRRKLALLATMDYAVRYLRTPIEYLPLVAYKLDEEYSNEEVDWAIRALSAIHRLLPV
ncbi:MAG: hypothetical protein DRN96_02630 [Thermoproteota archaeon]|nr:MAG: hypothetical protein DRN96_02630 [Candidatus Korarchaeota archaeon]